ncbi:MAG: ecotin family protein [Luteolibacter sp.]
MDPPNHQPRCLSTRSAPSSGPFFHWREPNLLRYNSRLPLVVHVPEEVEVLHRVWRAEPVQKAANEN